MKRKYILGGVIIALLMLMSTSFIASVPTVKGDISKQGDLIPLQGQLLAWFPYGGYYRFEVRVKNIGTKTTTAGHDSKLIWDGSQTNVHEQYARSPQTPDGGWKCAHRVGSSFG